MTRLQRIRSVLAEGPSTSSEIAGALAIAPLRIRACLASLVQMGHVSKGGKVLASGSPRTLYQITPRGMNRTKNPRRETQPKESIQ